MLTRRNIALYSPIPISGDGIPAEKPAMTVPAEVCEPGARPAPRGGENEEWIL